MIEERTGTAPPCRFNTHAWGTPYHAGDDPDAEVRQDCKNMCGSTRVWLKKGGYEYIPPQGWDDISR